MLPTYSLFGMTLRSDGLLPCPEVKGSCTEPFTLSFLNPHAANSRRCATAFPPASRTMASGDARSIAMARPPCAGKTISDFVVSGDGRRVFWRRLVDVPDDGCSSRHSSWGQVLSFLACCPRPRNRCMRPACLSTVRQPSRFSVAIPVKAKSTLAAALMERGHHHLLTDDVLVIQFEGNHAAGPSEPGSIKLRLPNLLDAVFRGRRSVPMNRFTHKMIFPLQADQHVSAPARPARQVRDASRIAGSRPSRSAGSSGAPSSSPHQVHVQ